MKQNLKIIFYLVLIFFTSCNKNPTTITKDVYVAGYANLNNAVYWKNDAQVILGNAFNSTDIAVSGYDTYVAGNIGFSIPNVGSANAAVYWKNGTMVRLGNDPSYANSIKVSGSDIYVCGYATINSIYVAAYWKNGQIQSLGNIPHSSANDITVIGSDVYVAGTAGQNGSLAVYWKNGVQVPLNSGTANAIAVVGSDVYVAGTTSGAVYWKNGQRVNLNDNSIDTNVVFTSATGIAVSGSDVHVIGYVNGVFAVYWKNGTRISLNNPATYQNISSNKNAIIVQDTDVYISLNSADYWYNGKLVHVGNGYASSIAIKP
jgi:hypothetical protein